jgi:hypothetical protein
LRFSGTLFAISCGFRPPQGKLIDHSVIFGLSLRPFFNAIAKNLGSTICPFGNGIAAIVLLNHALPGARIQVKLTALQWINEMPQRLPLPVPRQRGAVYFLFILPGRLLLWYDYYFPVRGNVAASARRRHVPLMEIIFSVLFWLFLVAAIALLVGMYAITPS